MLNVHLSYKPLSFLRILFQSGGMTQKVKSYEKFQDPGGPRWGLP